MGSGFKKVKLTTRLAKLRSEMNYDGDIPLKVYLQHEDSGEREVRRFSMRFPSLIGCYVFLVKKIRDIFTELSEKSFTVYWKDEEGDEVAISSDEELMLAMQSTAADKVKKFYVRVQSPSAAGPKKGENESVHFGVYCDGCERNISGVRYKCGICDDYDLCSGCRESDIHQEHPMYRIPHSYFDRPFGLGTPLGKHKSRRHSDGGKKKRRFEKRESGPETGDESEEVHHGLHSFHKKCKKAGKCPYTQLMNDLLGYFSPFYFHPRQSQSQNPTADAAGTEARPNASHLKNLGASLQKVLDPLGVSIEFEVRPKGDAKEEKKSQKDEKQPPSAGPAPSAPSQKEVRFAVKEQQLPEAMMQKIEEITRILSNQSMNNGSTDNDNGWVSYEDLKKDAEEPQPGSSKETPETSQAQGSAPEKKEEAAAAAASENQNLYPNLNSRIPSNPALRAALENMLAMGFTNEGNWLTSLLEAKNGDISQALEALSFQRNAGK